jgi:hypothetical protein
MLPTIAVMLIAVWLAALATASPLGGVIHVLPVIASFAVVLRLIEGRYPCAPAVLKRTRTSIADA